jgi:hypothetical protein
MAESGLFIRWLVTMVYVKDRDDCLPGYGDTEVQLNTSGQRIVGS